MKIREYNYLREHSQCPRCGSRKKKYLFEEYLPANTISVSLKCTVCKHEWFDHFTNPYLIKLEKFAQSSPTPDKIQEEIEAERLKQGFSVT